MRTLFINGKFAAQRMTGVQRLAASLIEALDHLLEETGNTDRWILLCPPGLGSKPPPLKRIEVRFVGAMPGGLHAWEQFFLPAYTVGRTLLNLSGPAPLLKRRQVCMIPDAAVFDHAEAYTSAYGAWYRLLFRVLSHSARLVLTISEFSRQQLIYALGPHAERFKLVYCAATHMKSFTPEPTVLERLKLNGVKYLLAVGSLNPTKNLPALVAAFRATLAPDVRLVLVGGTNNAVFAGQSLDAADDPRVITTGAISDGELGALYSHAHAFVFPSLYEGFGIPPLEAMSLGCPVVVAQAASIPEICGDAALYFDPCDIPSITTALQRILSEEALRETLRQRGAIRVGQFTWERGAQQLFDHLVSAKLISLPANRTVLTTCPNPSSSL
jgi:glycosyltransferase involved in cell wall biosynthesis